MDDIENTILYVCKKLFKFLTHAEKIELCNEIGDKLHRLEKKATQKNVAKHTVTGKNKFIIPAEIVEKAELVVKNTKIG